MKKVKRVKLTNKYIPASLWRRFLAFIVDMFVVNLVVSLPFHGYLRKIGSLSILFGSNDKGLTIISFLIVILLLFYFSFLEWKLGQTFGKMLFNIYVIPTNSKILTFNQSFLRNVTKPFSIVLLVDVVYMFFKRGNQRLFEVFSRTAVVEKEIKLR